MWDTDDYSILDIPGPAFFIPDPAVFYTGSSLFYTESGLAGYGYILLLLIPNVLNLTFQVMSSPSSSAENSRSTGTVLNV